MRSTKLCFSILLFVIIILFNIAINEHHVTATNFAIVDGELDAFNNNYQQHDEQVSTKLTSRNAAAAAAFAGSARTNFDFSAEMYDKLSRSVEIFALNVFDSILSTHIGDQSNFTNAAAAAAPAVIISPFSTALALFALQYGARGLTKAQIGTALRLKTQFVSDIDATMAFSRALHSLNTKPSGRRRQQLLQMSSSSSSSGFLGGVNVTTKIFVGANYVISSRYQDIMQKQLLINFSNESISNAGILARSSMNFHGNWFHRFIPIQQNKLAFYQIDNNKNGSRVFSSNVLMMQHTGIFSYLDVYESDVIQLGFTESRFTLTIVRPRAQPLEAFARQNFTLEKISKLDKWFSLDPLNQITLQLPRISIKQQHRLSTVLKRLGIEDMFGNSSADFSKLLEANSINNASSIVLHVDDIVNDVQFDLDEHGVTISAISDSLANETAKAGIEPAVAFNSKADGDDKNIIRLDSPFLFYLQDRVTELMLLIGNFRGDN